jgi:glycosyltransferase involved in cell wall biosynthesis
MLFLSGRKTQFLKEILMFNRFPKISIVTASYNQGAYIEECILSIVGQQYPNLEYIIIDAGSTDNSVEIIKKYEQYITYWVSEKDNGLYAALQYGFQKSTGEIMGWLNSDDLLIKKSLFTLADIFSNNPEINWIQGHPCSADELGRIVYQRPQGSSKYPFYLKEYREDGIFIQQESTYWRRDLWEKSGAAITRDYQYAGDFELWMRFYKYAVQYTTTALIGAFRIRKNKNQISAKYYNAYLDECDKIIDDFIKELKADDIAILEEMKNLKKQSVIKSLMKQIGLSKASKFKSPKYEIEFDYETQNFTRLIKPFK